MRLLHLVCNNEKFLIENYTYNDLQNREKLTFFNDLSDDEDHGYMSNWIADINYVHELQHALKLCKIEKEIIL